MYDWYKKELNGIGKITTKFANNLGIQLDPTNQSDIAVALRYQEFLVGVMENPLFLSKQYPTSILETPGTNLTALTPAQVAAIHGRIDLLEVDPYVAQFASQAPDYAECVKSSVANLRDPEQSPGRRMAYGPVIKCIYLHRSAICPSTI